MSASVKLRTIKFIEAIMLISFVVILVLLPLHAFLSTWLGTTIGPLLFWKSWKEIWLVLLVPLVILYLCLKPEIYKILYARLVNKVAVLFALVNVVLAATTARVATEAILVGLAMNLRFLAMFLLAQILIESGNKWAAKIKQLVPAWLLLVVIFLSVLAILQVTLLPKDFLSAFGYAKEVTIAPYIVLDDNPDALRAFATMRGPNTLGAYLLIGLAFAGYNVVKRKNMVLSLSSLSLGLIVLFLTGSRSAWLAAVLMLIVGAVTLLPMAQVEKWAKLLVLPVIVTGGVLIWASVNVPALRLAIFHSSPSDPYLFEGSTEDHWQATISGIQGIAQNPIGNGPGYAGPASFYNNGQAIITEDYFVQLGQEVGVLGLGLFLVICVIVSRELLKNKDANSHILLISFIGLTFMCIFQHTWADDPTGMTWWALAGLYMASGGKVKYNKH
ncbi:MAG: O-antigen ligase family protein [Candidatus Woesebacteria bacterium]|jgi:hypothetical protein